MKHTTFPMLYTLCAAITMNLAWEFCDSRFAPVLGWLSAFLLCLAYRRKSSLKHFFFGACLLNVGGFYWVAQTISRFGELPLFAGVAVLALFVVAFAIQWPLAVYIGRRLPANNLSFPISYVAIDFLFPKIFPWSLGHTQIHFLQLVQVVDILGVPFLVFLLLWTSIATIDAIESKKLLRLIPSGLTCVAVLAYGVFCIGFIPKLYEGSIKIIVPQANITAVEKRESIGQPKSQLLYYRLSSPKVTGNELVIWPESAFSEWVAADTSNIEQDQRLPRFDPPTNLLMGSLTFVSQAEFYNSALAIKQNGNISSPYHKRILMPFGEYVPFSSVFPFLKDLNSNIANFSSGKKVSVFDYDIAGVEARVSPLICYEDVIPSPARESVEAGATILANLTNDVWFGDSMAAKHHHQIASFRSLENRRSLIRSTNTGFTAVVDPLGQTIASLPMWQSTTLETTVPVVSYHSFYSDYIGGYFWWVLSSLVVIFSLFHARFSGLLKTKPAK